VAYLIIAVCLVGFGIAGLLSIGAPFLLTGVVMLACFPWRARRRVLWTALAGVWGFTLGYVLVAPLGCTETSSAALAGEPVPVGPVVTRCNGIFFDYVGGAGYGAPLLPAVAVGVVVATVAVLVTRAALADRRVAPAAAAPSN
jgi:hypothetical protein